MEEYTQATFDTDRFQTTTDTPDREFIGGHPVVRTTDHDGDEIVVCSECGNAALADSDHLLADAECDATGEFDHYHEDGSSSLKMTA